MTLQVRLNPYERGIVDALTANFGFTPRAARQLVVDYITVIRKLGGYDSCLDHAERLVQARNAGYSPEAWLERIRIIHMEAAKDKGIPHLERTEYVHVR
jgi:hypothetical protein